MLHLLGILLLLVMLFYVNRRARLMRLFPSQFPRVPAKEFLAWQQIALRSVDIVLAATVAAFVPPLLGAAFYLGQLPPVWLQILAGVFLLGWLGAGVWSAVLGTRARRRASKLGIDWRKRD